MKEQDSLRTAGTGALTLPERTNRLAEEKSPYLQEHAHNPVDWWPWGEEAVAKAKNDGKPIFLSIGYSTCHWCHVMRRESFEDQKTAAFLNKNFIPVKVDREERPEVDAYYMQAVQAMTGGGGWPLSVFLTPDLKPFYGGTYFPPEPRSGLPSFMQVLEFVSKLWKERRGEVESNARRVLEAVSRPEEGGEPKKEAIDECFAELLSSFDPEYGGFGRAPKFPLPGYLEFMLRYHFRTKSELALKSAVRTLDGMMCGGIRDHVGGGFHRYSTDRVWLVPHFEKMLYDNALLAKVYTEAYQVTGEQEYAGTAREALGWLAREMEGPEGGFYSAQDADTEEGEGAYYSWTPREVLEAAGESDGRVFNRVFGATDTGNFEGRSLLHRDPSRKVDPAEARAVARAKEALLAARTKRPRPATDEKILTSWNGLAVSAYAYAASVLRDRAMLDHARRAARFVLSTNAEGGRLLRRYAGGEAGLEGTIEDYSFFVQGLIDLFEADPDPAWLEEAARLAKVMVRDFEDAGAGGFFFSAVADPVRLKQAYDGPTPSGNAVAAVDLVRLAELTGDESFRKSAERTVRAFYGEMETTPSAHAQMFAALDLLVNGVREVVISAETTADATEMKEAVFRVYAPDRVLVTATAETFQRLRRSSPLLEGREPKGKARGFVCHAFSCKAPADSAGALAAQLALR
jgi:uncharacterized protein YyaL (SSP411 family)